MTNLNRVYFPLRSNIGWFQSDGLRSQIANRVKEAILIYDEIIVEDGTFTASITEHGSSAPYLPPGYLSDDERTIEFERDLKPDQLIIGIGPEDQMPTEWVNFGLTSARYKIDYFDIFRSINLSSYNFIKRVVVQDFTFPQAAKDLIQRHSHEDRQRFSDLDRNTFARNLIINSLNTDLIASVLLKSAVVLDARHGDLLRKKSQIAEAGIQVASVNEQVVVRRLISMAAPDFSSLTIEQVLELREDTLWQDFRNYVGVILDDISSDPETLVDERAFEDRVRSKIERDLFESRKERHVTGKKLSVDLSLGLTSLIPGYGIISTASGMAKSIDQYLRDKSGWFAFLLKLESDE